MASSGFGNNRLATGFHKTRAILAEQAAINPTGQIAPLSATSSSGASAEDAIELSDDELSSDGGGMLLNVGNVSSPQPTTRMAIDNESESEEEGELVSPKADDHDMPNATRSQNLLDETDAHASQPGALDGHALVRLADLSQPELELQIRYVFSYLKRDEIDPNCFAVCLECLQQGHMQETCPENICTHCGSVGEHPSRICPSVARCTRCRERGHSADDCATGITVTTVPCDLCSSLGHPEQSCPERFFPPPRPTQRARVTLWVYCCHCASKSHYVGDCPDLLPSFAPSWSIKPMDPDQIINLSLGSNMKTLEMEAENRGLRPQGLSIKGKAGLHHAGRPASRFSDNNGSEDEFLRPKIEAGRRIQSGRHEFTFRASERFPPPSSDRPADAGYDRYNPPSTSRNQRPRNDWYSTDSFGQRQSKSPSPSHREDFYDTETFRRRSRSPRVFNDSRVDRVRARSPRMPPPTTAGQPQTRHPPVNRPNGGVSVNLPVRRGSSGVNYPPSQQYDQPTGNGGSTKTTKKKSKQNKAATRNG